MKAKVAGFNHKKTKLDKSFDFSSTAEIGEIQPCLIEQTLPDSTYNLSTNTLCQLAPLQSPLMGRLSVRKFTTFVDMRDVFHHFDELLTGRKVTHGQQNIIVTQLPTIKYDYLIEILLRNSIFTMYCRGPQNTGHKFFVPVNEQNVNSSALPFTYLPPSADYFVEPYDIKEKFQGLGEDLSHHLVGYCNQFFYSSSDQLYHKDYDRRSLMNSNDLSDNANSNYTSYFGNMPTVNDADFVYTHTTDEQYPSLYASCFRLTSKGRRLRKVLLGLGLNIDINVLAPQNRSSLLAKKEIPLTPFLAYYKAWFDLMYPTREINFADTACGRLITEFDAESVSGSIMDNPRILSLFSSFIDELTDMHYVFSNDYFTSHLTNLSNTSDVPRNFVEGSNVASDYTSFRTNGVPIINTASAQSNTLTSAGLKVLQAANNYVLGGTLIGKKVNDYLRQYGITSNDDTSHFLGSDILDVDTGMIMSTTSNDDVFLGQKGGHGEGRQFNKKITFTAKRFGYLISFIAVVPKSNFSQGIDNVWNNVKKMDFYNQRYDGVGYELTPFYQYFASNSVTDSHNDGMRTTAIGYTGRYNRYKYKTNISSGDFSRRPTRYDIGSFYLDKRFTENEVVITRPNLDESVEAREQIGESIDIRTSVIPSPTPSMRFCREEVFNYNRIFVSRYDNDTTSKSKLFFEPIDDHFTIQQVNDFVVFAPVLPISDSWGSDDGLADNANIATDINQS